MNMKKIYKTPVVDVVEVTLSGIIAFSFSDDQKGEGELEEAANEYRGDWENIWQGM